MSHKFEILYHNFTHFDRFEVIFDHFGDQKDRFLGFFKVLELFRECLGIFFGLKRPIFDCIFSPKGS